MTSLTLILGGARSGKSSYAEKLARQCTGRVLYIATAQALDAEMATRIAAHKDRRPPEWQTLEIPRGLAQALKSQESQVDLILLDCLTLLVSNLLMDAAGEAEEPDEQAASALVEAEITELLQAIQASPADWVVVSNEVGLGLVPPYPLGRIYRDLLGWANQRLAAQSDQVIFMIAGIPMRLARLE
jgi:adenosylcobinamide kinase/adenosylcobinamide-phosphate guanylyltransferase